MQRKDHARRAKSISKQNREAASAADTAAKNSKRVRKREMKKAARMINKRVLKAEEEHAADVEVPTDQRLFNPNITKPLLSPTSTMATVTPPVGTMPSPEGSSKLSHRHISNPDYDESAPAEKPAEEVSSGTSSEDDPFRPPQSVVEKLAPSQQMKDFSLSHI